MAGDWRLNADDCGKMFGVGESEKGKSDNGAKIWVVYGMVVAGE